MSAAVSKLLSVHIPSLHPPASTEIEALREMPAAQTAAIVGLGLLYQVRFSVFYFIVSLFFFFFYFFFFSLIDREIAFLQRSAHRRIAEVLLAEIGRRASDDRRFHRYSFSDSLSLSLF